jgi:hypothetical protein
MSPPFIILLFIVLLLRSRRQERNILDIIAWERMWVHAIIWKWVLISWAPTKHFFMKDFNRESLGFRIWSVIVSETDTFWDVLKIRYSDFGNDPSQVCFIFLPEQQFTNIRKDCIEILSESVIQRWPNKEHPTLSIERKSTPIHTLIVLAKGHMNITKGERACPNETIPVSDMIEPDIGSP